MLEVPITMAVVVIGLLIGLGLFALFTIVRFLWKKFSGESDRKPTETYNRKPDHAQPAQAEKVPTSAPPAAVDDGATPSPLLWIARDEKGDVLKLWAGGAHPRQLQRGKLTRQDEKLLMELQGLVRTVLGSEIAPPVPDAAEAVPHPAPVPMPRTEQKPAPNGFSLLGREKVVVDQPVSMALQMNAILQEMLKQMPGDPVNLRIEDGPNGGLRIWHQSRSYDDLEQLPDPQIRSLIHQAAERWVAQNT